MATTATRRMDRLTASIAPFLSFFNGPFSKLNANPDVANFAVGNPQGRIVQPEEVADTVRWLCDNAASAINRQSISVCGGAVMT